MSKLLNKNTVSLKILSLSVLVVSTSLLVLLLAQNSRYKKFNLFARATSGIRVTVRKSGEAGAGTSATNVYQNEAYIVRVVNPDGTLYNGYLDFSFLNNGVWTPPAPWKDQNGNLIAIVNGETIIDLKNYRNSTTGTWLALGSYGVRFRPTSGTNNNIVSATKTPAPTPALSSCKSTLDGNTGAYLEAEKYSAVSGSFAKVSDSTRSNGAYMHIPKGKGSSFDGKSTTYLTYNLNVVNGGTFNIFLLGYGLDSASDSFYVSLDGGTPVSRPLTLASWGWVKLSTTFSLPTGSHTLKIIKREDGSRLDKIYLSKSSTYPSGLGGSAVSCN